MLGVPATSYYERHQGTVRFRVACFLSAEIAAWKRGPISC